MLNVDHLRKFVIRPTLMNAGVWLQEAEDILVGTALVESGLEFLRQGTTKLHDGEGVALGIFQMEPATHDDIWRNYLDHRENLSSRVQKFLTMSPYDHSAQMVGNLPYAALMARIHYLRVPIKLPTSVEDMAEYWKLHYNTMSGKGNIGTFITLYLQFGVAKWEGRP